MRVLVFGGRSYYNRPKVYEVLSEQKPSLVITGEATGADSMARDWAAVNGIPLMVFPAHWRHYSKAAGPVRNNWMIAFGKPDMAIGFRGGRGTLNMAQILEAARIKTVFPDEL